MPHASLLVIAAPIMFGPVAPVEVSVAIQPAIVAVDTSVRPDPLLPISWSMTAGQEQGEGPQDGEPGVGDEQPENEIVVEGEFGPPENDPVAVFNETSYRITQELDEVFLEPVAYAYRDGLPGPIRDGLGNVVRNLGEPANFLNFLLQFKIGKAFETLGRFAINSTLGLGGLIDIAEKPGIGLPYRRNGFANTLGYYGVGPGAYLYLPITGATSARDLVGNTLDQFILPVAVGSPFNRPEYAASYFVINGLDARLEVDEELERIGETIDPYAARRDTYLYRRARDIAELRGEEPPAPPTILREIEEGLDEDDFLDEPEDANEAPEVSVLQPRELPPIAVAVVVTQPGAALATR